MAAVIDLRTGEQLEQLPVTPLPVTPRPSLRLIEGGRSRPRPTAERPRPLPARTYRRRRVIASAVAAVVVLSLAQLAAVGGRALLSASDTAPTASGRVHVVRSGDTAWSIAARYAPSMERRDAVDELLTLNGRDALRPGEEIRLPASYG